MIIVIIGLFLYVQVLTLIIRNPLGTNGLRRYFVNDNHYPVARTNDYQK
jgi:hypothetical protein